MTGSILSVGHSPELLRSRSLLLRSRGFLVVEETRCKRALELALHDNFDLLLLCHSLKKSEINSLLAELSEKFKSLRVLCIRKNDFASVPPEWNSAASSPDILLNRVEAILGPGEGSSERNG